MACSVAGITSDANVLTNELRLMAQRYRLEFHSGTKVLQWFGRESEQVYGSDVMIHGSCIFHFIIHRYLLQYGEPIPCEQLVSTLCDVKQAYTQFGGE